MKQQFKNRTHEKQKILSIESVKFICEKTAGFTTQALESVVRNASIQAFAKRSEMKQEYILDALKEIKTLDKEKLSEIIQFIHNLCEVSFSHENESIKEVIR